MPAGLGNLIVTAVLAAAVVPAVRSLRKPRKSGGSCNGDCTTCGGCHGSPHTT